jgi:Sel1 repeat
MQIGNVSSPNQDAPQPLFELAEAQLAIEIGTLDLPAAMNRAVGLALKFSRATGAATWLFRGQDFVRCAEAGSGANNQRLQLDVLSKLATIRAQSDDSLSDPRTSNQKSPVSDASQDQDSIKSLLVAPIYHGRRIAGALAVFSADGDAFTEHDATNARLLSGLLTHALGKSAEAELMQHISLERATMLQAIDQLIPTLRKLAENQTRESPQSPDDLPGLSPVPGSGSELTTVQSPESILRELGEEILKTGTWPAFGLVAEEIESQPHDGIMPKEGESQTSEAGENSPLPDSAATSWAQRQLSRARYFFSTTKYDLKRLSRIAKFRLRGFILEVRSLKDRVLEDRVLADRTVKLRFPYSTFIAVAILLIVLVFVFSIIGRHTSEVVAATSTREAAPMPAPASRQPQELPQPPGRPEYQSSHIQVTDPAISSALRNLSRYEIAGLQRQAEYGDDDAAFLLGMVYETGYLVPQNCAKAAQWVTQSANEGNTAAQYNLGLRYRLGDGVPINQDSETSWLRKAAAQKYSAAERALASSP